MRQTPRFVTLFTVLLALFTQLLLADSRLPREGSHEEGLVTDAVAAIDRGDLSAALMLYDQLEKSADSWYSWVGTSGKYVLYMKQLDFDSARTLTRQVTKRRPDLSGLMLLWDGHTAALENRRGESIRLLQRVSDEYGKVVVDGEPLGVLALEDLTALFLEDQDFQRAAQAQRAIISEYPTFVDPVDVVGKVLSLESHLDVSNKRITNPDMLDREYVDLLERALRSTNKTFIPKATTTACEPKPAASGFQAPFSYDATKFGLRYLISKNSDGTFHPAIDLNGSGLSDDDCLTDFKAVADGCVTFTAINSNQIIANTATNWTTAIIRHLYVKEWRSQYAHGDKVYVVPSMAVVKGGLVGNIGKVGSGITSCHLHLEIRENEGAVDSGTFWKTASQAEVADYYQNPLPFIAAHPKFTATPIWWDENEMTFTGTWTPVTSGDEDDFRYAATTSTSLKNAYARKSFTPSLTAFYKVFAFVPYSTKYTSSKKVPVKIVEKGSTSETVKLSTTIDQAGTTTDPIVDAWVSVGIVGLTKDRQYYLEVATNTGEAGLYVGVDDFLLVPAN